MNIIDLFGIFITIFTIICLPLYIMFRIYNYKIFKDEKIKIEHKLIELIIIISFTLITYYFSFEKEYIIDLDEYKFEAESSVHYDNIIGKYVITIKFYQNYKNITVYANYLNNQNQIITTNEITKTNIIKDKTYTFEFVNTSLYTKYFELEKIVGTKKGLFQFLNIQ